MSESDEWSPWAPDGHEGTDAGPPPPAVAASDDPWAPPIQDGETSADTPLYSPSPLRAPEPPPAARTQDAGEAEIDPVDLSEPVESVTVGPVGAEDETKESWLGRGLALVAAAALITVGGYVAFGVGTASGGADSPEAALEMMFEALAAEDLVEAAELLEPVERETVVEAGFDLVHELILLEVFADDLDLETLGGIDIGFTGLEVRAEIPRSGVAHLFVDGGAVSGSVDASELPLGDLLLERLPPGWLSFTDSGAATLQPTDTPVVAIEHDGRWYLSLWYTVAENLRLAAGAPPPDPDRRPVRIGAETPEEAIRTLFDEALRLDAQRMIGMLDPEETAALYDYSPLFLDSARSAANEALQQLRDDGWAWELTNLGLDEASTQGDTATVAITDIDFAAANDDSSLDVEFSHGSVRVAYSGLDYWGDRVGFELVSEGECFTMTMTDWNGTQSQQSCTDEFLPTGLDAVILSPLAGLDSAGIVTHQVEGRWYVSPLRTGSEAYLTLLRSISAEELAEMVDGMVEFGQSIENGVVLLPASPVWAFDDSDTSSAPVAVPAVVLVNDDLIDPEYELLFGSDLDAERAETEISWLVPGLTGIRVDRGVSVTVDTDGGQIVLLVMETPNRADAYGATALATEQADATGRLLNGSAVDRLVEIPSELGDTTIVAAVGTRLVIAQTFGAADEFVLDLVLDHLD